MNLFGYKTNCLVNVHNESISITLPDENQKVLQNYLRRVLKKYGQHTENDALEVLISKAIQVENHLGTHMSEPKVKLPYEVLPEIKEKLIEAATIQGLSATQLLIRIIETQCESILSEGEGIEHGI